LDTVTKKTTRDWLYIEWLRQASNVSTLFRLELANVLWSATWFIIHGEASEHCLFPQFLQERPAVRRGIKDVNLSLYLTTESGENLLVTEHHNFAWWCDAVSKLCQPEALRILIIVYAKDIEMASKAEGQFSTLAASKKLQVTKTFAVDIDVLFGNDEDYQSFNSLEEELDAERKLRAEFEPLFTELMYPDCLRKSKLLTEKEKYLESRLEPV